MLTHRQQFRDMLLAEMNKWGLIQQGWEHAYTENPGRRLAYCNYRQKLLFFQLPYIDANPIVVDGILHETIKHEIGHALCPGVKHGAAWKAMARIVGYNPVACKSEETNIPAKYTAVCKCKTHRWFRKPRHASYKCKRCFGILVPTLVME